MKLSNKGIKKMMAWASNDIKGDLKEIDFCREDFTDGTVLSVKEANFIYESLIFFSEYLADPNLLNEWSILNAQTALDAANILTGECKCDCH